MTTHFWIFVLLVLPLCHALGQRPALLTEHAGTIGKGRLGAGVGFEFLTKHQSAESTLPRSLLRVFLVSIHHSVAENVNFDLDWRGGLLATLGNGERNFDWGDLTVSTKITFVPERNGIPSFGLRTAVKLPNTTYLPHRLGSDQMDYHAHLLISKSFPDVEMRLNIGFSILGDPQHAGSQDDVYSVSAAALVPVDESTRLFAEFVGLTGYRDDDDKLVSRFGALVDLGPLEWNLYGSLRIAGNNRDFGTAFEHSESWGIGIILKKMFDVNF